ncbi:MAG: fluoride efflux transporter CrcB [Candidatus Polarisedimenticolia bacterium]
MWTVLLVGAGGFAGSVARFLLGGWVQGRWSGTFPAGTLAVNVLGCLAIGGLSELAEARAFLSPEARALVVVGFLGGFTTFSAFGNETFNMLRDGAWGVAAANVALNVVPSLTAVWAGRSGAHLIWR